MKLTLTISIAVFSLVWAFHDLSACAAGYESGQSLVKKAKLIIEVQPTAVRSVPAPKRRALGDEPKQRQDAVADIKVLRVVKGKCDLKGFELVGGPYYSCAPEASYIHFKKDEKFFLILSQSLPPDTTRVVLTWRCRATAGKERIQALMKNARNSWRRSIDWHRKASPKHFAEAQQLAGLQPDQLTVELLKSKPYPVLACLRVLLLNPDSVPDSPRTADTGEVSDKEVYRTQQRVPHPLPKALVSAMEQDEKRPQQSVIKFNRQLLSIFLGEELFLPAQKIKAILNTPGFDDLLTKPAFSPYDCDIRVRNNDKITGDLKTLAYLIPFADDEPDSLAWKTFCLPDDLRLNGEMIGTYVEKNQAKDYDDWGRIQILLAAPHTKTAPTVKRLLQKNRNSSRLDSYFRFFIRLKDYETADKILKQYNDLVFNDSLAKLSSDEKKRFVEYELDRCHEFDKVMNDEKCDRDDLREHVKSLTERVRSIQKPTPDSEQQGE